MSDLRVVSNIIMQIKQRNELILSEGAGKSFQEEAFKEWIQTLSMEKEKSIYNEKHDALVMIFLESQLFSGNNKKWSLKVTLAQLGSGGWTLFCMQ